MALMTIAALGTTRPGAPLPRQLNYNSKALFHWRAQDALLGHDPSENVLKALTGEAPTFVRATAGAFTRDALGRVRPWGQGTPRLEVVDLAGGVDFSTATMRLERQVTHEQTRSADFNHADWTKTRTTIGNNLLTAPNGVVEADKLIEDGTAANTHFIEQVQATAAGADQSWAVRVKAGEDTFIQLEVDDGTDTDNFYAYFNLTTGVVSSSGVNGAATKYGAWIVSEGDGWYWCLIAGKVNGTEATPSARLYLAEADGDRTIDGDSTSGVYLWGADFVEGTRYPFTHMPTAASGLATNLDSLVYTIVFAPDLDDFTLYVEMARPFWADLSDLAATNGLLQVGDTNGRMSIYLDPATELLTAQMDTATTDRTATVAIPTGDPIRITAQFRNVLAGGEVRIGAGSGFSAFSAKASALSAWATAQVLVGRYGATDAADAGLIAVKVLPGLQTELEAQRAF